MNARGLFSFVLVSLFLIALLAIRTGNAELGAAESEAENYAIKIEKISFERGVIERDFDSMIKGALKKYALEGVLNGALLKENVLREIVSFAEEEERIHNKNSRIDFYLKEKAAWNGKFDFFPEKEVEITRRNLRENISVFVFNPAEAIYVIEFTYTGGIARNWEFGAEVGDGKYAQNFVVPAGYRKVMVVGV